MAKRIIVVICVIFARFVLSADLQIMDMTKNSNYGRFRLSFDSVATCNQTHNQKLKPKVSDVAVTYNNETGKLNINISIFAPCRLQDNSKSKIIVERVINGTRQMLVRYNINNPCTHFAMVAILKTIMKINQKCVIEKGFYSSAVDMQKTAETFVGPNYFYEDFAFHSVLRCASGVFLCMEGLVASRKLV